MLERRLYLHLDWLLLSAIVCLTIIGVAMIYSTSGSWRLPTTQMYAIVIGAIAFAICLTVDYRAMTDKSHFIYLALLALLIYVLLFGTSAGGARRWISLGAFNLQPSEFAKVGVALVLAQFFGENRRGAPTTGDLFIAGVLAGIPLILIAREPDLGTAVTLLPIYLGIAYVAGMRLRIHRHPCGRGDCHGPDRVEFRAQAVSEKSRRNLPRPVAGPERGRLSADPGADHRRLGRLSWARVTERAHRGSSDFCRSPITISSSRRLPKNRVSSECCSCSACI